MSPRTDYSNRAGVTTRQNLPTIQSLKFGAIHHDAAAAFLASADYFALLLDRDRSAHWASNFAFVIDRLSRFRHSFR